ncbi:MAG: Cell wall surface anchor family protein [Parcubacteria group bacterium GW2011_GWA1_47_8]|nr:MAG: Cell wall surface anchor family protein [Parcubacteria group bacterium GW2011_GWA1_47_8]
MPTKLLKNLPRSTEHKKGIFLFKKFFLSLATIATVGSSLLNPVQAASLSAAMAELSVAVTTAELILKSPSGEGFDVSAASATQTTLAAKYDAANLTAQVELKNAQDPVNAAKAQLALIQQRPTDTQEKKVTVYLDIAATQLQIAQLQLTVAQVQTTLITIAQAKLTLAQLGRAIAVANSNVATIDAANIAVLSAQGAVSLATSLAQSAASEVKTAAEVARVSAERAATEADTWVLQAQDAFNMAKATLLATNSSNIFAWGQAENARDVADATLQRALAAQTRAGILKTDTGTIFTIADSQIAATALVIKAANDQLQAESASASASAAKAGATSGAATSGAGAGPGSALGGSGGAGKFIAGAITPCAAVAVASVVGPWAVGALTTTLATASAVFTVPTTNPVEALPTGISGATQQFKDFGDCLIYTMGQLMLNNLTESTVNWIKGGFNGSPSFATNINVLLDGSNDIVGGDFVRQLRGVAVCDFTPSFKMDLTNDLELSAKSTRNMFKDKVKCPFGDDPLFSYPASSFYEDFSYGGWRAFETAMDDAGNPFGVTITASRELNSRQQKAADTKKQQLSWSGGFADLHKTDNPALCAYPADLRLIMTANTPTIITDPNNPNYLGAENVIFYQKTYCPVTTPGKIVQEQLTQTLGTDMNRIGLADSLDKIIQTLITTLVQDAVKGVYD